MQSSHIVRSGSPTLSHSPPRSTPTFYNPHYHHQQQQVQSRLQQRQERQDRKARQLEHRTALTPEETQERLVKKQLIEHQQQYYREVQQREFEVQQRAQQLRQSQHLTPQQKLFYQQQLEEQQQLKVQLHHQQHSRCYVFEDDKVTPISSLQERSSTPYSPTKKSPSSPKMSARAMASSSPKDEPLRGSLRVLRRQHGREAIAKEVQAAPAVEPETDTTVPTMVDEPSSPFPQALSESISVSTTSSAAKPVLSSTPLPGNFLQLTPSDIATKELPRIDLNQLRDGCNVNNGPVASPDKTGKEDGHYLDHGVQVPLHPLHANLRPDQHPFTIFIAPGLRTLPSHSGNVSAVNPEALNTNYRFYNPSCTSCHCHDVNTPGNFSTCEVLSPSLKWLEINSETIKFVDMIIFYKTVPHANSNFWIRLSDAFDHAMVHSGFADFDYYDNYNVITPSYLNKKSSLLAIELLFKAAFYIALELQDPYLLALVGYSRHQPYHQRVMNAKYWFSQQPQHIKLVTHEEILVWMEQALRLEQIEFPILVFESILVHFTNRLGRKNEPISKPVLRSVKLADIQTAYELMNEGKSIRRHPIIDALSKAYGLYEKTVTDYWAVMAGIYDSGNTLKLKHSQ